MTIVRLLALSVVALLISTIGATAADEKKVVAQSVADLERLLGEKFSELKVPGASVVVMENNQVVLAKGYGLSDVAKKAPVTVETLFRAGSISKSFVGVAVMMLVEEGKLDLNAKLSDLAPEIKFINKWEGTDAVRLAHLMEHTTGFDDIRFSQYLLDGKDTPLLKAVELYGPYESRWKPGTYVSYSNAPPVIAGYIVEKASGMSWAEFTRKRIFEPLGMSSAHWDPAPEIMGRLSKSYKADGVTEEPYFDIPGKPAGSLNVTPSDLSKFALMLAGRGTYNGVTLLKPESVDRLETPGTTLASRMGLKNGYGFGNLTVAREKTIFHGHDGGIDGFLSTYMYDPLTGSGLIIMINASKGEALSALDIVVDYLERARTKPVVAKFDLKPSDLEKFVGTYQSIAPRQQMLAPLEALFDWTQVKVEGGKLSVDNVERVPVSARTFQRLDRAAPSLIFADTESGLQMLTSTGARRLVPESEIMLKLGYAGAFAFSLLVSAIFAVVWMVGLFQGRLAERGGVMVRAVPFLALIAMIAFSGLLVLLLTDDAWGSIQAMGTKSPQALTLYWLSLSVPVLGGLSVVLGMIAGHGTSLLVRALALLNGMIALTAAAFLWPYGWIGLQIWL